MRAARSMTGACNVSASSMMSFKPFAVRAVRSSRITGFSAATIMRAASATEPGIALRRGRQRELGNVELGVVGNRPLLQFAVRHQ